MPDKDFPKKKQKTARALAGFVDIYIDGSFSLGKDMKPQTVLGVVAVVFSVSCRPQPPSGMKANSGVAITLNRGVEKPAGITEIHVLKQNWTEEEANWFYNVPQGSKLIPYEWFLHLEQPESQGSFREPAHIRSLGYLPRVADGHGNPDGLPIGFVKDGSHLGLTCAACHTTQINYNGQAWLVDGAPTLGDIERFQRRLVSAIDTTVQNDEKFGRFATAILGSNATTTAQTSLREELKRVREFRHGFNERNLPKPSAPPFGPGRIDAFGVILNEVTSTFANVKNNHFAANAPVSYPFIWDTPQHDHVQWNGAAPNFDLPLLSSLLKTKHVGALARNVGEVFGVFGEVDAVNEGGITRLFGYSSSIRKDNLIAIEESLRKLWSPSWPAEFPPIDNALKEKGKALFVANCKGCHAIDFNRVAEDRRVTARMESVGTDQTMARNFATRIANSGVLKGRKYVLTGFSK
jgi:cytochrome c5